MFAEPTDFKKPTKNKVEEPAASPRKRRLFPSPLFLWAGVGILVLALFKGVDFIEVDDKGNLHLSKKRQRKMEREIERLDEAEQYVLVALENRLYPCFNCPGSTTIDLKKGEVWKYGITILGEKGRYTPIELTNSFLGYIPQFRGDIKACLAEEKRKIYFYPLLPENTKRPIPLIRPPGNKIDH